MKKGIKTVTGALDAVDALRGVTFTWKDSNTQAIGLIAQEVEEILPNIVKETETLFDDNIYKSVSYEKLIPFLIKSIQELTEEINKLKGGQ